MAITGARIVQLIENAKRIGNIGNEPYAFGMGMDKAGAEINGDAAGNIVMNDGKTFTAG